MSKPKGKCVFCGELGNLTKGHVWPDWIADEMLFEDTHHIQLVGHTFFDPSKLQRPSVQRTVRQGHGTSRKPRNTCKKCNTGWMSRIENNAKPATLALIQGQEFLLSTIDQILVSSLMCLITMRNEFSSLAALGVPKEDRGWLRSTLIPPWRNWRIWLARYAGRKPNEHWAFHYPMHVDSSPTTETGPDKCNTQTTTLVIGQLCAHIFSSSIIGEEMPGYEGIHLTRIWPPSQFFRDLRYVPAYSETALIALAEALAGGIPANDD